MFFPEKSKQFPIAVAWFYIIITTIQKYSIILNHFKPIRVLLTHPENMFRLCGAQQVGHDGKGVRQQKGHGSALLG